MKSDIVFLMSSERSGSNLLRTLLARHSKVTGPVAPHFLKIFSDNETAYFARSEGPRLLFEDMMRIANHQRTGWGVDCDFDSFRDRYRPRTFLDFFDAFYGQRCLQAGVQVIVCKENDIFDYADALNAHFGDRARFVYLHRDPRDCAASWMNVPMGLDDPLVATAVWVHEQEKCQSLLRANGFPIHQIGYEELLADTEAVMTDLLRFLGLPPERACYGQQDAEASNENSERNEYFKNLGRPVMKGNTRKFLDVFDSVTLFEIETIASTMMGTLGYEPLHSRGIHRNLLFRINRRLNPTDPTRFKRKDFDRSALELMEDWMKLVQDTKSRFETSSST